MWATGLTHINTRLDKLKADKYTSGWMLDRGVVRNTADNMRPSVVERLLKVRWVVRSIPHGGLIQLFLVPVSAPRRVYERPWYVLSCLWGDAYKTTLAVKGPRWRSGYVIG